MTEFWRDIRFGVRLLRRSPGFTLTVSLLLGIGIGANTLIFSIVDMLLLRPLPVRHPEQLVRLVEIHPTGFMTWDFPHELCDQLASTSSSLTDVFCQGDFDVALEQGGAAERIRVNAVSTNYFETLGISALLGRVLKNTEDKPGAMNAVVSYNFWRRRLSGSTAAIGRAIRLNGRPFTVVGVLPKGTNGLTVDTSPEVRVPFSASPLLVQQLDKGSIDALLTDFQIFGRLRPGVALAQAQAEIEPLLHARYDEALIRAFPELAQGPRKNIFDSRLSLEAIGNGISALRAQFSRGLVLLMACVALLLCMTCANVAGLLLARASARSQEISVRLALGAGKRRVVRQLLTESVILAAAGGAIGILMTYAGAPLLVRSLPAIRDRSAVLQPLAVHVDIDTRVLAFAVLVSLLAGALFGLLPAIRGARGHLAVSLRGSRTTTSRLSTRNILAVAQIAICVLLLTGSSLLVRSFRRMQSLDPGFDRDHVVTFTLDPSLTGYTPPRARLFSKQLLDNTRSLPTVVAAGLASRGLMRGTGIKSTFGVAGTPIGRNEFLNASLNSVTPGYFEAMGMRIVAGRDFSWSDTDTQKPQRVIVNQAFVHHFFPGQNAVGKLFGGRGPNGSATAADQIIGVVSDAKYRSLREKVPPTVYSAVTRGFDSSFILHLRTRGQPDSLIAPVRDVVRSLDPELPLIEARTLREEVETSLWQERLLGWLSTCFSCFAAVLTAIGLYGVLDYAVKSRTREIGIRVAVGANPARVAGLLSADTLFLVAGGVLAGVAAYAASASWIRGVLYGVSPSDPAAIVSALLFVALVSFLATAPAVWRASRTDPASALRHE